MSHIRPMIKMKCQVCGIEFDAVRSKALKGERKVCSIQCRGKSARRAQKNPGRKPSHGGCSKGRSDLYKRWDGIKARCVRSLAKSRKYYGGRGITMCEEWQKSFPAFESWAMANGFSPELQIDRINNNEGYSPENCRWVSAKENNNNKRNNIRFPSGEGVNEVAKRLGISARAVRHRIYAGRSLTQVMNGE